MTTTINQFLPQVSLAASREAHPLPAIQPPHTFDQDYLNRLASGDPEVGRHFARYFGNLLVVKLRSRLRSSQLIEDARQETLLRVLHVLRNKGGVKYPERFGAFVNGVCNHVVAEFFRTGTLQRQIPENAPEPVCSAVSAESLLISEERKAMLRAVLGKLSPTDQLILRKAFLEERDSEDLCRELGLGRANLRVRIHRALRRLRTVTLQQELVH